MQVARPVDAAEHVPKERGDVVHVEPRIVLPGSDPQVLGQRELPLAENRVGRGQQLLRTPALGKRRVTLTANGQQQRMHPGSVDGMHRVQARYDTGNCRSGQLVNQLAEHRVFLRRTPYHGEGPHRVGAMPDRFDP